MPYFLATLFAAFALTGCSSTQTDHFEAQPKQAPAGAERAVETREVRPTDGDRQTERFEARPKSDPDRDDGDEPLGGPRLLFDPSEFVPVSGQQGELEIHFIQVGQGDATLLELPNGTSILVDAGSLGERDPQALRDYLEDALDDDRIDTLVITHPDSDHYNLLPYVVSDIEIGQVLVVGETHEHGAPANVDRVDRGTRDGFHDWLDDLPTGALHVISDTDIDAQGDPSNALFDSGDVDIWIVSAEFVHDTNSRSIVLLVSYGDFDLMLTGDAEEEVEDAIIAHYDDWWLDVECLKLGHHGSAGGTSEDWVDATQPEIAIASAAEGVEHGHPNQEIQGWLEASTIDAQPHRIIWWENRTTPHEDATYGEAVYSTATNGTIVIATDGQGFDVTYAGSETGGLETALRIVGVLPNPDGDDRANEAARISNPTETAVDLANWRIADSTGAFWELVAADGPVPAGGTVEVVRQNRPMSLNNSGGDDVVLIAPSGTEVDRHSFGDAGSGVWINTTR